MAQALTEVNNYIYELDNKIYVNLTNACTNNCLFCIRTQKDDVKGANMWLTSRPTFDEIISQLNKKESLIKNGITFCGYGEPLIEAEMLIKVAKYVKEKYPNTKIKINTNGHANYIQKRNVVPELKNCIDEVSISLNAQNKELYNELSQPKFDNAYEEMLDFGKKCVENNIKTTFTVVTGYKDYDIDIEACKKISQDIGANFRERPWIKDGY